MKKGGMDFHEAARRVSKAERGKKERRLHQGPEDEQKFTGKKKKEVSGHRNNTSKSREKWKHVASLGTGCGGVKRRPKMKVKTRPDREER